MAADNRKPCLNENGDQISTDLGCKAAGCCWDSSTESQCFSRGINFFLVS